MRTLILLLLALPLASCAIPSQEQRAQLKATQLADAENACSANPHFWRCVNNRALHRYGMRVKRQEDGEVILINAQAPFSNDPGGMGLAEYGSPNGPPY